MYLSQKNGWRGRFKCDIVLGVRYIAPPANTSDTACKVWCKYVDHSQSCQSRFHQPYLSGNIGTVNGCLNGHMYRSKHPATL